MVSCRSTPLALAEGVSVEVRLVVDAKVTRIMPRTLFDAIVLLSCCSLGHSCIGTGVMMTHVEVQVDSRFRRSVRPAPACSPAYLFEQQHEPNFRALT